MDIQEIQDLQEQLRQAEEDRTQAAEIGKALLEENARLQEQLEENTRQMMKQLEEFAQEKYSLNNKLDSKNAMEAYYLEEIASLKEQIKNRQDALRETHEQGRRQIEDKFNKKIEDLQSAYDKVLNSEAVLKYQVSQLEELLQSQANQTEIISKSFLSDEMTVLQEEVVALQNEKVSLKSQLIESKSGLQKAMDAVDALQAKVAARDSELEDIQCQYSSLCTAFERVKMENLDMKAEMDALRIEASCPRKKGNSLFSEVEDRRVTAEKKLISLKTQMDELKKKYDLEKQQNHKYKMQMLALFHRSSGQVNSEHVARLEAQISQYREEIQSLLEENQKCLKKEENYTKFLTEFADEKSGGMDTDYVHYLCSLLECKDMETEQEKQKNKQKTMQLLDLQNRISACERKVFEAECERDKVRSQNLKIALKIEELRMKYEPDQLKKHKDGLTVKKIERIAVPNATEEVKISETSCLQESSQKSKLFLQDSINKNENVDPQIKVQEKMDLKSSQTCITRKTVSISDDIDVVSVEQMVELERTEKENDAEVKAKPKGRRVTAVRQVTAGNKYAGSIDDCKTQ
ncbi:hypothetical protein CHS0354_005581 [Potamilus streckersoni]|uniref:Protein Spindly n=1 Tax=Potamilus streckersoni TaxID=2493646 RepID=A0AAE0RNK7_9BIVA|nr:hypothetical protein CHS0354_005581 [Potamilus streckersoni]